MSTWALFVQIDDKWRFEGFTEHEELVTEFEETVSEDIEETTEMESKTTNYCVLQLEGQYKPE